MPIGPTGWKPVPRPAHLLFNEAKPSHESYLDLCSHPEGFRDAHALAAASAATVRKSFYEEYVEFLERHDVAYNERYVFKPIP